MSSLRRHVLLALLALVWAAPAVAHRIDIAHFTITELGTGGAFEVAVHLTAADTARAAVDWPAGCAAERLERALPTFRVVCPEPGSATGYLHTAWGTDGAIVNRVRADGSSTSTVVAAGAGGTRVQLEGATVSWWASAARYLDLGTQHVLVGIDHLAFVLCLSLLARGATLLWLVSAFTVGHSLSLALAHAGFLTLPAGPVEAVIALSVVFMAREVLVAQRAGSLQRLDGRPLPRHLGITLSFGVIHGLGFAGVLEALDVPGSSALLALAFFNVGVEIGQLLFVGFVLVFMWSCRQIDVARLARTATVGAAGGLGMYWTVERILGM